MIVGRETELRALEALLDGARSGRGGALVIRGEPGIGKTTCLDALAERCGDKVTVLRARGVETEAELAFSGLSDLLGPVVEERGALPAPQAAALAAALALGPPAPGDRLGLCVATLGLLRAAAVRRPVVAIVDDVQWLDASSRECVLYAARRAGGALAVVLALRDHGDVALERALPELRLAPVDAEASLALLRRAAPGLAPAVAQALAGAAAGNPLALVELPATLTPDQRTGRAGLEPPVAPGRRLQAAFAGRLEELDPLARRALLVAAAHGGPDLAAVTAACARAGTDAERLVEAEARGLVRIGAGRLAFTHPVIRGAAYHAAGADARRQAHRALAEVVGDERSAWHRAAATVGADEQVAAALERVAGDTAARRGYASAAAALERAARLSPERGSVARRLTAAGQAAGAAGAPERALDLLEEAADVADDGGVRARAQHLRGRIMVWSGSPAAATSLLEPEAQRAAGHDRALAATMLADAANGCTNTNAYGRAEALARRAVELLDDASDPSARAAVLAMHGWTLVLRGEVPRARPVLDRAERLAEGLDPLGPHWPWLHLLLRARIPLGEFERARDESAELCRRARDAGALATLGGALLVAADVAVRLGDWEEADRLAEEALRVAGDSGHPAWRGFVLCTRARMDAARGREAASREALAAALAVAEQEGISSGLRFVHGTRGLLELSLGRVDAAIAELELVERLVAGSGLEEPTIVPWSPDLVEAYARAGRGADAERALAALERQAAATATAYAGAVAARCRGMLAPDYEPAFAAALALHDRRPVPFERARTLLALGRRLHRAGSRGEARERLREALAGFERLGAMAWAAQAQDELRAAGGRRRFATADDGALTGQEARIAAAVRRGASNREIAAELFLAPKTIEYHLGRIYRKLGVRSRTQLIAALGEEVRAVPRAERRPAP